MIRSEIWLPVVTLALIGMGLLTLSSAAPGGELTRQVVFLGVALTAAGFLYWLGRQRLMRLTWVAYIGTIFLLLLTKAIGTEVNGAKSWLDLGPLPGFQPSELAKLAIIMALAQVLHERPIRGPLNYMRPAALIGLPVLLVVLEPDLGSALVIAAIGAGVVLARGIPWWHLVLFAALFAVAVPTVVWPNLDAYQRARIISFTNPEAYAKGSGYQVIQSRIAIGSGGLWGKGYKQGTQSQLGFIPERHNDFIFSVLAEEGGFIGAVTLLALYGLLFWRLVVMAGECPYERDQLLIVGVLVFVGFQVVVNIGVTLGLAPVTGITLPLISYGGTSLVSTVVALSMAYITHRDRYADW